jgi:hypothetical protein
MSTIDLPKLKSAARHGLRRMGFYQRYDRRTFKIARSWSNGELSKFAGLFSGSIVNISAWQDLDKEGRTYQSYFSSCSGYFITNFGTDQGVLQGWPNEYYLNLEQALPSELSERFDVVFNHTTLEHIFDFRQAFRNLCRLSKDCVIIVVPWLQPLHSNYGDYWRFSPQALVRLFEENQMKTLYLSWNNHRHSSVYIFAIASKAPKAWSPFFPSPPCDSSLDAFFALPKGLAGGNAF